MPSALQQLRTTLVTEEQLKAYRRWSSLYIPALLGIAILVIAAVNMAGIVTFDMSILTVTSSCLLVVLSLHRAHEYKNGFSDWERPMWPATMYAGGLCVWMVSLRYSSVLLALAGSTIVVGTAYLRRDASEESEESADEDST
jgi:hypothetical protein